MFNKAQNYQQLIQTGAPLLGRQGARLSAFLSRGRSNAHRQTGYRSRKREILTDALKRPTEK